jgi:hypothetical protein
MAPERGRERQRPQGTVQGTGGQRREYGQTQGYNGNGGQPTYGPGQHGGWWPPYPGGGYQGAPYPHGMYPSPPQFQQGGQTAIRDWRSGWNDERNPKIKALMQGYLERTNGRVHLAEILAAAGKGQTDLPTLPKYVHPMGRPFLCWSSILGRCTFRNCRFRKEGGHPLPTDVTDNFVDKVINVIGKGVITSTGHTGGSPAKKQKGSKAGPGT